MTQRQATCHLPFGGTSRWVTAALLAQDHIRSQEVVAFPELGMETVWKITVENFPAFILVDNKACALVLQGIEDGIRLTI